MSSSSGSSSGRSSRRNSHESLTSMLENRRRSIAQAQANRPQVSRPCEDRHLMQNGKMAHDQLLKHKAALTQAVSKKDTKKAAAIRQTINAMENSEIYKQYRDCLVAMKTYGATNPREAAKARDRHIMQKTAIANRERRDELLGLGRRKRTRKRKGGSHHCHHKRKTKTHRHKKRKRKSTRRR